MESAIELETSPALSTWAWYAGAIQQYHYALLILIEIYAFPMRKEADRIWACLDYIYEVPPGMSREQKGRWIITQIRDKTNVYMSARKARAPAKVDSILPPQAARSTSHSQSPTNAPSQAVGKMQPISPHSSEVPQQMPGSQYAYDPPGKVQKMPPTSASGPPPMQSSNPMLFPSMPDAPMVDIDWVSAQIPLPVNLLSLTIGFQYEWDKLFPPDINTGELNLPNVSG